MHQFTQGIASQNKNNDDSILIVPCQSLSKEESKVEVVRNGPEIILENLSETPKNYRKVSQNVN